MCGIVGMAGNINVREREVFKDMLIACQVRGRDATGAFSVGGDNSVGWAKTVGTPDRLFEMKTWDRAVDRFSSKILVGHCRAKTVGENVHQNAHPFDHENVIGVHNGTLEHGWRIDRSSDGFKVDSDWLLSQISEHGVETAIPRVSGAWTLNWWDRRTNTINFLRNEERPLWFAWSTDKKTMFWASEPWMLTGVVGRQIKLAELESGRSVCALAENELWSFEVNKAGDFKASSPKQVKGRERAVNFTTMGGGNPNTHYRRLPPALPATTTGGSRVTGPFREGTPDYLLESLGKRIGTAQARLPGLPAPASHSVVQSKPNEKPLSDATTTQDTSDGCTTRSLTPSDSPTEPTCTLSSLRKTGSRPLLSLVHSRTTSKGGRSGAPLTHSHSGSTPRMSHNIDIRKIGSLWYITDRKTGREWSELDFERNTDRTCSWCQAKDLDLRDVHEFIDEWNFVCVECDKDIAANQ